MSTPFLKMSDVRFAAGERTILSGIDLSLESGRIYGLVGPNGPRKSRRMTIMARQVAGKSGMLALEC